MFSFFLSFIIFYSTNSSIIFCILFAYLPPLLIWLFWKFIDSPTIIPPSYDHNCDPSYTVFPSLAPSDSWKCSACSEKYKDPLLPERAIPQEEREKSSSDGSSNGNGATGPLDGINYRGVWNKPLASTCRFCTGPRYVLDHRRLSYLSVRIYVSMYLYLSYHPSLLTYTLSLFSLFYSLLINVTLIDLIHQVNPSSVRSAQLHSV